MDNKEISHPIHPKHKLRLKSKDEPFHCDGCQEPGVGARYTCKACRFNLHEVCAAAPGATLRHHLLKNCTFTFRHKPPRARDGRICHACGKHVHGSVYHCAERNLDLHPRCASLPLRFTTEDHTFSLRKGASDKCKICKKKGSFWFYRSECKKVYLHLACVKNMEMNYLNRNKKKMEIIYVLVPVVVPTQNDPRRRTAGKFERYYKIVVKAISIIIATILDPTMLTATAIGALMN